jgi:hypothetical protein
MSIIAFSDFADLGNAKIHIAFPQAVFILNGFSDLINAPSGRRAAGRGYAPDLLLGLFVRDHFGLRFKLRQSVGLLYKTDVQVLSQWLGIRFEVIYRRF